MLTIVDISTIMLLKNVDISTIAKQQMSKYRRSRKYTGKLFFALQAKLEPFPRVLIPTTDKKRRKGMSVLEIIAIILTAIAGSLLLTSLTIFTMFTIKEVKEKSAEKLLGGFAITFVLAVVFITVALIFIMLTA